MKVLSYLLFFLMNLWLIATPSYSASSSQGEVDRRILFNKGYELLAPVLASALDMGFVSTDLDWQEMSIYNSISKIVNEDFISGRKDRLQYLTEQSHFELAKDQPARTAVTSSDVKDPIYVNQKLINNKQNNFELEDVFQILIHEYGHKIPNKIQNKVDSLAVKLRGFISRYIHRSQIPTGETLLLFSLPAITGNNSLMRLTRQQSRMDPYYYQNGLLYQALDRILDVTQPWVDFQLKHPVFQLAKGSPLLNVNYLQVQSFEFEKNHGTESSFVLETARLSAVNLHDILGGTETADAERFARNSWEDQDFKIVIDRKHQRINSIQFKNIEYAAKLEVKASLISKEKIGETKYALTVQLNEFYDDPMEHVKLVLRTDSESFAVKPTRLNRQAKMMLFEIDLPASQRIQINSLTLNSEVSIFLDKGFTLEGSAKALPSNAISLESIQLLDGKASTGTNALQSREDKMVVLKMKIKSLYELQELRLGISEKFEILKPSHYKKPTGTNSYLKDSSARPDSVEGERYQYNVFHLDPSEFKQTKIDDSILVEVLLTDKLKSLFLPSDKNEPSQDLIVGWDSGVRKITHLELLDKALQVHRLNPNLEWIYSLIPGKNLSGTNSAPLSYLKACRQVFTRFGN